MQEGFTIGALTAIVEQALLAHADFYVDPIEVTYSGVERNMGMIEFHRIAEEMDSTGWRYTVTVEAER